MSSSSNKTDKKIKARGADALASISGSALSSANNMPMLSSISERLSILLPLSARQGALPALTVKEHSVSIVRYGEVVAGLPSYCVTGVGSVPEMRSSIFVAMDGELTKRMIFHMLGGRPENFVEDNSTFTQIGRGIAKQLMERVLFAVADAFASVLKINPKMESIDIKPGFATVMSSVTPVTVLKQRVSCYGVEGNVLVIIPRSALDPIRETLSTIAVDVGESEEHWLSDLRETASEAPLLVDAVIGKLEIPLSEIFEWSAGTQITLPPIGEDTTMIVSNGRVLGNGRVGRFNGRMGVLINDVHEKSTKSAIETVAEQGANNG